MSQKLHVKTGDTVVVISGKDKGKQGKITAALPKKGRVVVEGVKNASYEEIVEFHMEDGTQKIGRIVEIYEDKAVIQVFEGTDNMSLGNTNTRLNGHP